MNNTKKGTALKISLSIALVFLLLLVFIVSVIHYIDNDPISEKVYAADVTIATDSSSQISLTYKNDNSNKGIRLCTGFDADGTPSSTYYSSNSPYFVNLAANDDSVWNGLINNFCLDFQYSSSNASLTSFSSIIGYHAYSCSDFSDYRSINQNYQIQATYVSDSLSIRSDNGATPISGTHIISANSDGFFTSTVCFSCSSCGEVGADDVSRVCAGCQNPLSISYGLDKYSKIDETKALYYCSNTGCNYYIFHGLDSTQYNLNAYFQTQGGKTCLKNSDTVFPLESYIFGGTGVYYEQFFYDPITGEPLGDGQKKYFSCNYCNTIIHEEGSRCPNSSCPLRNCSIYNCYDDSYAYLIHKTCSEKLQKNAESESIGLSNNALGSPDSDYFFRPNDILNIGTSEYFKFSVKKIVLSGVNWKGEDVDDHVLYSKASYDSAGVWTYPLAGVYTIQSAEFFLYANIPYFTSYSCSKVSQFGSFNGSLPWPSQTESGPAPDFTYYIKEVGTTNSSLSADFGTKSFSVDSGFFDFSIVCTSTIELKSDNESPVYTSIIGNLVSGAASYGAKPNWKSCISLYSPQVSADELEFCYSSDDSTRVRAPFKFNKGILDNSIHSNQDLSLIQNYLEIVWYNGKDLQRDEIQGVVKNAGQFYLAILPKNRDQYEEYKTGLVCVTLSDEIDDLLVNIKRIGINNNDTVSMYFQPFLVEKRELFIDINDVADSSEENSQINEKYLVNLRNSKKKYGESYSLLKITRYKEGDPFTWIEKINNVTIEHKDYFYLKKLQYIQDKDRIYHSERSYFTPNENYAEAVRQTTSMGQLTPEQQAIKDGIPYNDTYYDLVPAEYLELLTEGENYFNNEDFQEAIGHTNLFYYDYVYVEAETYSYNEYYYEKDSFGNYFLSELSYLWDEHDDPKPIGEIESLDLNIVSARTGHSYYVFDEKTNSYVKILSYKKNYGVSETPQLVYYLDIEKMASAESFFENEEDINVSVWEKCNGYADDYAAFTGFSFTSSSFIDSEGELAYNIGSYQSLMLKIAFNNKDIDNNYIIVLGKFTENEDFEPFYTGNEVKTEKSSSGTTVYCYPYSRENDKVFSIIVSPIEIKVEKDVFGGSIFTYGEILESSMIDPYVLTFSSVTTIKETVDENNEVCYDVGIDEWIVKIINDPADAVPLNEHNVIYLVVSAFKRVKTSVIDPQSDDFEQAIYDDFMQCGYDAKEEPNKEKEYVYIPYRDTLFVSTEPYYLIFYTILVSSDILKSKVYVPCFNGITTLWDINIDNSDHANDMNMSETERLSMAMLAFEMDRPYSFNINSMQLYFDSSEYNLNKYYDGTKDVYAPKFVVFEDTDMSVPEKVSDATTTVYEAYYDAITYEIHFKVTNDIFFMADKTYYRKVGDLVEIPSDNSIVLYEFDSINQCFYKTKDQYFIFGKTYYELVADEYQTEIGVHMELKTRYTPTYAKLLPDIHYTVDKAIPVYYEKIGIDEYGLDVFKKTTDIQVDVKKTYYDDNYYPLNPTDIVFYFERGESLGNSYNYFRTTDTVFSSEKNYYKSLSPIFGYETNTHEYEYFSSVLEYDLARYELTPKYTVSYSLFSAGGDNRIILTNIELKTQGAFNGDEINKVTGSYRCENNFYHNSVRITPIGEIFPLQIRVRFMEDLLPTVEVEENVSGADYYRTYKSMMGVAIRVARWNTQDYSDTPISVADVYINSKSSQALRNAYRTLLNDDVNKIYADYYYVYYFDDINKLIPLGYFFYGDIVEFVTKKSLITGDALLISPFYSLLPENVQEKGIKFVFLDYIDGFIDNAKRSEGFDFSQQSAFSNMRWENKYIVDSFGEKQKIFHDFLEKENSLTKDVIVSEGISTKNFVYWYSEPNISVIENGENGVMAKENFVGYDTPVGIYNLHLDYSYRKTNYVLTFYKEENSFDKAYFVLGITPAQLSETDIDLKLKGDDSGNGRLISYDAVAHVQDIVLHDINSTEFSFVSFEDHPERDEFFKYATTNYLTVSLSQLNEEPEEYSDWIIDKVDGVLDAAYHGRMVFEFYNEQDGTFNFGALSFTSLDIIKENAFTGLYAEFKTFTYQELLEANLASLRGWYINKIDGFEAGKSYRGKSIYSFYNFATAKIDFGSFSFETVELVKGNYNINGDFLKVISYTGIVDAEGHKVTYEGDDLTSDMKNFKIAGTYVVQVTIPATTNYKKIVCKDKLTLEIHPATISIYPTVASRKYMEIYDEDKEIYYTSQRYIFVESIEELLSYRAYINKDDGTLYYTEESKPTGVSCNIVYVYHDAHISAKDTAYSDEIVYYILNAAGQYSVVDLSGYEDGDIISEDCYMITTDRSLWTYYPNKTYLIYYGLQHQNGVASNPLETFGVDDRFVVVDNAIKEFLVVVDDVVSDAAGTYKSALQFSGGYKPNYSFSYPVSAENAYLYVWKQNLTLFIDYYQEKYYSGEDIVPSCKVSNEDNNYVNRAVINKYVAGYYSINNENRITVYVNRISEGNNYSLISTLDEAIFATQYGDLEVDAYYYFIDENKRYIIIYKDGDSYFYYANNDKDEGKTYLSQSITFNPLRSDVCINTIDGKDIYLAINEDPDVKDMSSLKTIQNVVNLNGTNDGYLISVYADSDCPQNYNRTPQKIVFYRIIPLKININEENLYVEKVFDQSAFGLPNKDETSFSTYLVKENVLCDNSYTTDLSEETEIEYCDCNVIGLVAENVSALQNVNSHADTSTIKETTVTSFDSLGRSFYSFYYNLSFDTENTDKKIVLDTRDQEQTALVTYFFSFFSIIKSLYRSSNNKYVNAYAPNLNNNGVVLGVTEKAMVTYNEEDDYDEIMLALARLLGCSSVNDFVTVVSAIAAKYSENSAGASINVADNRLKYNGAVYTQNYMFILPYAFVAGESIVLAYITIDSSASVYAWISSSEITSLADTEGSIRVYGRCNLFDNYKTSASWGNVSVLAYYYDDVRTMDEIGSMSGHTMDELLSGSYQFQYSMYSVYNIINNDSYYVWEDPNEEGQELTIAEMMIRLTSKPVDWESNFNNYYVFDEEANRFVSVTPGTPWSDQTKFYSWDDNKYLKSIDPQQYLLLDNIKMGTVISNDMISAGWYIVLMKAEITNEVMKNNLQIISSNLSVVFHLTEYNNSLNEVYFVLYLAKMRSVDYDFRISNAGIFDRSQAGTEPNSLIIEKSYNSENTNLDYKLIVLGNDSSNGQLVNVRARVSKDFNVSGNSIYTYLTVNKTAIVADVIPNTTVNGYYYEKISENNYVLTQDKIFKSNKVYYTLTSENEYNNSNTELIELMSNCNLDENGNALAAFYIEYVVNPRAASDYNNNYVEYTYTVEFRILRKVVIVSLIQNEIPHNKISELNDELKELKGDAYYYKANKYYGQSIDSDELVEKFGYTFEGLIGNDLNRMNAFIAESNAFVIDWGNISDYSAPGSSYSIKAKENEIEKNELIRLFGNYSFDCSKANLPFTILKATPTLEFLNDGIVEYQGKNITNIDEFFIRRGLSGDNLQTERSPDRLSEEEMHIIPVGKYNGGEVQYRLSESETIRNEIPPEGILKSDVTEDNFSSVFASSDIVKNVGSYLYEVSFDESANYKAIPVRYYVLTIEKATLTLNLLDENGLVSFGTASKIYDGQADNYPYLLATYSDFKGDDDVPSSYNVQKIKYYRKAASDEAEMIEGRNHSIDLTNPYYIFIDEISKNELKSGGDIYFPVNVRVDANGDILPYYARILVDTEDDDGYGFAKNYKIVVNDQRNDQNEKLYPEIYINRRPVQAGYNKDTDAKVTKIYDGTTSVLADSVVASNYSFSKVSRNGEIEEKSGLIPGDELFLDIIYSASYFERKNVYEEITVGGVTTYEKTDVRVKIRVKELSGAQKNNYVLENMMVDLVGIINPAKADVHFYTDSTMTSETKSSINVVYNGLSQPVYKKIYGVPIYDEQGQVIGRETVSYTQHYYSNEVMYDSDEIAPTHCAEYLYDITISNDTLEDKNYIAETTTIRLIIALSNVEIIFGGDAVQTFGNVGIGLSALAVGVGDYSKELEVAYYTSYDSASNTFDGLVADIAQAGAGVYYARAYYSGSTDFKPSYGYEEFTIIPREVSYSYNVFADKYPYSGESVDFGYYITYENQRIDLTILLYNVIRNGKVTPYNYTLTNGVVGDIRTNVAPVDVGQYQVRPYDRALSNFTIMNSTWYNYEITIINVKVAVKSTTILLGEEFTPEYLIVSSSANIANINAALYGKINLQYYNSATNAKLSGFPTEAGTYRVIPEDVSLNNYNVTFDWGTLYINNKTIQVGDIEIDSTVGFGKETKLVSTEIQNVVNSSFARTFESYKDKNEEMSKYNLTKTYQLTWENYSKTSSSDGETYTMRIRMPDLVKYLRSLNGSGALNGASFVAYAGEETFRCAVFYVSGNVEIVDISILDDDRVMLQVNAHQNEDGSEDLISAISILTEEEIDQKTEVNLDWLLYVFIGLGVLILGLTLVLVLKRKG